METKIVSIDLGERAYDIYIGKGLLFRVADFMPDDLQSRSVFLVADKSVSQYATAVSNAMTGQAARVATYFVPSGEQSKSFDQLQLLCSWLLDQRISRNSVVVSIGGGVVGDLAGFASSIIMRGVSFVQIPTTLLAQVDSSVGGKTGINAPQGKNLIGSFHQPSVVIADLETLTTLPRRELLAGYAEIVKYGLIENASFFEWLELNGDQVTGLAPHALAHAIETSIKSKAEIVEADEHETTGRRALLNFGHTFGHALEAAAGYDGRLLHGEAVSIGMCMAMDLSSRISLCPKNDYLRLTAHLEKTGLPTRVTDIQPALEASAYDLVQKMRLDKKAVNGAMRFVVSNGIGQAEIRDDIADNMVLEIVQDSLRAGFD
jgi:3-dehydroquinate synthase